jgi:hypothetical protein
MRFFDPLLSPSGLVEQNDFFCGKRLFYNGEAISLISVPMC